MIATCDVCGEELIVCEVTFDNGTQVISVKPCQMCNDDAYQRGWWVGHGDNYQYKGPYDY